MAGAPSGRGAARCGRDVPIAQVADAAGGGLLVCGDIQPGAAQTLRFNINELNFIERYAPELRNNTAAAVDYRVIITRL